MVNISNGGSGDISGAEGVINILDRNLSNMIAAGEVVDRPAGAVKELCENSIDAGATQIKIEIKGGGASLIRVTDNGKGMSRADAEKCILRHATSKIKTADDLSGIATMGFRGEALAAISSVSRFSIYTKRREDPTGTLLTCDASGAPDARDAGCPDGTAVTAEDLFYNQPARRKFLKRESTEASAVLSVVQKLAVANTDVSFSLYSDGLLKLSTRAGSSLKETVYSVFGKEFSRGLINISGETAGILVHGMISTPENSRQSRSMQMFFVNKRPVRDKTILLAVDEAYKGYMKTDKYPSCVLFIDIDTAFVDVNVHPTKMEIRFSNDRLVYEAVYIAVKNAVMKLMNPIAAERSDELEGFRVSIPRAAFENAPRTFSQVSFPFTGAVPKSEPHKEDALKISAAPSGAVSEKIISVPDIGAYPSDRKEKETSASSSENVSGANPADADKSVSYGAGKINVVDLFPSFSGSAPIAAPEKALPDINRALTGENEYPEPPKIPAGYGRQISISPEYTEKQLNDNPMLFDGKIRGSVFDAFIIYEHDDVLFFIDKHAAHERILYEKLKASVSRDGAQELVVPVIVTLTPQEKAVICDHIEDLKKVCVSVEEFGENEVAVRAIPAELSGSGVKTVSGIIQAAAEELLLGGKVSDATEIFFDRFLYTMACKAAVKAGIPAGSDESEWIIAKLREIPNIITCPHGRPIIFSVTKYQLEKMFFRT